MDILKELENAERIGIAGHVRPDGDCVGACLGLWNYLKNACPEKTVCVYLEQPPQTFSFLKGIPIGMTSSFSYSRSSI